MKPPTLKDHMIRRLARIGAIARLAELQTELHALRSILISKSNPGALTPDEQKARTKPTRRKWSAAARARQARRMREYWRQNREEK